MSFQRRPELEQNFTWSILLCELRRGDEGEGVAGCRRFKPRLKQDLFYTIQV